MENFIIIITDEVSQIDSDIENLWSNGAGYQLDQPGYDIYAVGISDYYYDDNRLENDFNGIIRDDGSLERNIQTDKGSLL